ncbi:probable 54S ribosomal protein L16, mitochondrial [Saccharomycodes ludwigii]|uniref:Probable 54S ribosomal protein L16, mitochondrial n=1 Tax=Saccharomycodes ludwigii TaxID=36035 RepID=A0A376B228_9ASCO|nr:hypothetical protein SCDLUD_000775 [Saccharomycodes ludwigii]KAH3903161.1 hypothetical protein SCDLUD_000775 [Saccharomycodes ludwigii]SSD58692.1 probable 54S ribosomal protein L16, mitochondrial [Saccharomycodes ludwigii]
MIFGAILNGSGFFKPSTVKQAIATTRITVSTFKRFTHEYAPRFKGGKKSQKGRVPVRTGGSISGSTLQFGTYGLRLKTEGVRLTALQLQEADNAVMRYIRQTTNGKMWRRLVTDIAVCIKGNETRMGKGKGAFDHWMCRVPTGKIIFEISGDNLHEKVARDAFRKAGTKLPGVYEFVKKDSLCRVGLHSFKNANDVPKKNYFQIPRKDNEIRKLASLPEYKLFRGR